jgi:hypothetical protein
VTLVWSSGIAALLTLFLLKGGALVALPIAGLVGRLRKKPKDDVYPTVLSTYHYALLVGITGILVWTKAF